MVVRFIEQIKKAIINGGSTDYYYSGYSMGEYYKDLNVIGKDLASIISLFDVRFLEKDAIVTSLEIKPYDLPFGSTERKALKIYGNPTYTIDNSSKINNCTTFFYKKKISNIKLITQLHFFERQLFFARTDFTSNLSITDLNEKVMTLSLKKYTNEVLINKKNKITIKDTNGNLMFISANTISPSINYFSGQTFINEKINTLLELKRIEKSKKEKLMVDELFKRL